MSEPATHEGPFVSKSAAAKRGGKQKEGKLTTSDHKTVTMPKRTHKEPEILEDGEIIIETYTEDGQQVKITPPGYLPFDKTV